MSLKKKILAVGLAVCMAAIMVTGMTLAYFTAQDDATNTFTLGNVDIELTEPNWTNEGESLSPSVQYAKDPTVENVGANDCYVRVQVTYDSDIVTLGDLGDGWTLHTDGYYYYNTALANGVSTTPVFSNFTINDTVTNEDAGSHEIVVNAYAVQTEGITMAGAAPTVAELATFFNTAFGA